MNLRETIKLHRLQVMKRHGRPLPKPPVDYQRLNHLAYECNMTFVRKQNERLIAAVEKIANKKAEPVAMVPPDTQIDRIVSDNLDGLYAASQQQAEPVQALLRDALEMIQSLPWESETSTQKRGETLQGHRDRMSSVMERNEMRRDLISAIEATLAQQAEPVADSGNPSY